MEIPMRFIILLVLSVSTSTYGRLTPVLMEERFDNCPCEMQMGGYAHRPWKVYYEIDRIGEKQSRKKCSLSEYGPMPLNYNFSNQGFCTRRTIPGNGSYILRSCIRENDNAAVMELFNFRRTSNPICGADVSLDEIETQDQRECNSSCSSQCGDDPRETTRPSPSATPPSNVDVVPVLQPQVRVSKYLNPALKLIHGTIVTEQDVVPYVVLTGHNPDNVRRGTLRATCTGSLIGKRWVLTAGHCNNTKGDAVVIGRRWDDKTGRIKEWGQDYKVRDVHLAPNYRLFHDPCDPTIIGVYNDDIAVLELESEVDNAEQKAVHLNTDCRYPHACSHLRVSGHGRACTKDENESITQLLRTTVVRAIDARTCESLLKDAGFTLALHELRDEPHICALHDECGSGLCNGDSGGPLVMRRRWNKRKKGDDDSDDSGKKKAGTIPVQVGVATWHVDECGRKNRPDVYEPVSGFVDWIDKVTNGEAKMYPPLDERTPEMRDCPILYEVDPVSNLTIPNFPYNCGDILNTQTGGNLDRTPRFTVGTKRNRRV